MGHRFEIRAADDENGPAGAERVVVRRVRETRSGPREETTVSWRAPAGRGKPPGGHPFRVREQVGACERDLRTAELHDAEPGRPGRRVLLRMTEHGAARLKAFTEQHIGRRVAVLLDGKLLCAPRVWFPLAEVSVLSGEGDGFTDEQARAVVDAINSAIREARDRDARGE